MSSDKAQSEPHLPITHRELSEDTKEFVEGSPHSADTMLRVHKAQRNNPHIYLKICERIQNPTYRGVLTAVKNHNTATYEHIEDLTTVSRRSIREAVNTLQDDEIVEKENSRLVMVSFKTEATELLTADALGMFFDMH